MAIVEWEDRMSIELKQVLDKVSVEDVMMQMTRKIYYKIGFPLAIIAILKGGAFAAYEILKLLDDVYLEQNYPNGIFDIVIGHIGLESYGEEMKSSGEVKLMTPLDLSRGDIRGRKVVIIDDCVEAGNTLSEAKKIISGYAPQQIYTAVLVDKVSLRKAAGAEIPDIVGWQYYGNGFLVGVGMGAGERYRGLRNICEVVEENKNV